MLLRLKLIIILSIFLIESNHCQKNKKRCDLRRMEDGIHIMFSSLANKNGTWPENEREMNNWCKAANKEKRYIKSYADNCLKGLSRPVLSVMTFHASRANKFFCKNKYERNRFIDKGVCGNAGKDGSIKCWNEMHSIIGNVAKLKNPKDKIPTLCCSFYWFKECVLDVYKKLVPTHCFERYLEHANLHLEKVAMDSFRVICNDYEDRDKCVNYRAKLDRTEIKFKHKTPFPIAFEILESL